MPNIPCFIPMGLAATCIATASSAQNYNSFAIEVPYEFSLPSAITNAKIGCNVAGADPNDPFIAITRDLVLENGQASGAFKIGYVNFGSADDLVPLTEKQIETLKRLTSRQGFELKVDCAATQFDHESGTEMVIVNRNSTASLKARWSAGSSGFEHGPYALDQSLTNREFTATFRAEDNGLGRPPPPQTATTTVAPTVSEGLQSLQSILQGE